MKRKDFEALFSGADETKRAILGGLIEEAWDCKEEITDLKKKIADQQKRGVATRFIAVNERTLNQKRACYTNMMSKLCRELCVNTGPEEDEGLEEYE